MIGVIKKYFQVLWIVIRNSFYKISAYRANFFSGLITDFCFNISRIVFVNVLLLNVPNLGGWEENHYLLFFGSSFLAESIYMFFFYNSHTMISQQINNGDMDFLLTKPISEMFILSTMNINFGSGLSNFVLGIVFVIKGIAGLNLEISVSKIIIYGCLILGGSIVYFSISFMINLLSFWFVRAGNVFELFTNITDLYRYPSDIFPKIVSMIITFIIPFQLISITPAKYMIESVNDEIFLGIALYPILFFVISYYIMRAAIAVYTSASS